MSTLQADAHRGSRARGRGRSSPTPTRDVPDVDCGYGARPEGDAQAARTVPQGRHGRERGPPPTLGCPGVVVSPMDLLTDGRLS